MNTYTQQNEKMMFEAEVKKIQKLQDDFEINLKEYEEKQQKKKEEIKERKDEIKKIENLKKQMKQKKDTHIKNLIFQILEEEQNLTEEEQYQKFKFFKNLLNDLTKNESKKETKQKEEVEEDDEEFNL